MRLDPVPELGCLCASLRRAARAVTRLYEREIRMSVPQFTLLYVLDTAPLIQAQIAEILTIDRTTLTRTLAMMERRGLIRGVPGEDKREYRWSITAAGRKTLALARPRWEKAQDRFRERLGNQRWDSLLSELTNVAKGAHRPLGLIRKTRTTRL